MLAIYLIVAAIIIAGFFYYAGQWEKPKEGFSFWDGQHDIIKVGFCIAIFWPIILVLIIVLGPFALFFYLGEKKKAKRNNNS